MEEEEISKRFVNFLRDRYYTKLLESVKNGEASLSIDFQILDEYDSQLTESLLYKPVDTIRIFEDSIKEIDVPLSEFLSAVVKQQLRLRFFNLPEFSVIPIRNLRAQHIGQFVSVEGTVRRASEILPAIVETTWLCPKCRNKTILAQQEDVMKRPVMCDCGYQGKFDLADKKLIDTRWITVEEPFELTEGERPSQLNIFLREDLTSLKMRTKTDPGNRLKITGVLKEVSQSTKSGKRSVKLGTMLEANHVESTEVGFDEFQITPEEEQKIVELSRDPEIYEKLIGSIAPSTYGLREIKEALAMQLFSGVPHVLKDEIRIRGDIHILITGDPSTGKSQILKLVARIANRGKYVSGKGVTGVGLTASVVKDEQFMGGWVLEAGAVVLCNKGLCSIDEFEKMHKDDQVALHEAMEQQSYHYQTPVTFSDGTVKPIGEFVEDLMKSYPERIISGNNCLLLPTESLDIKVFSTDFNKIKEAKITRISKHTAPKHFVRIKSQNGREVMVTPEHPIFVIRNGKVECASADSIKTGEFLPIPRILPLKGKIQNFDVIESEIRTNKYNSKHITIPTHNSPELFRFLGYMESEGCSEVNRGVRNGIIFTNTDERLIGDFKKSVKSVFGVDNFYVQRRDGKATLVRVVNKELANFINMMEPSLFQGCEHKKLPNFAMKAELSDIKHLIETLFNGDGFYTDHKKGGARIGYSSNSKQLVFQIQELLLRFGIRSSIYYQKTDVGNDTYKLSITGIENLVKFDENFNLLKERKQRLEEYVKKQCLRTIVDVIPNVGSRVIEILKGLKLSQKPTTGYTLTRHAEKTNFSRTKLQFIIKRIENEMESLEKIRSVLNKKMTIDKLKEIRNMFRVSHSDVAKKIGVCHQSISYWELNDTNENNLERFRNGLLSIIEERLIIKTDLENLRTLAFGEVDWCNVIEVGRIPNNGEEWVYDITVEPSQNFISNYMVLHNSVSVAKATIVASLPAKTSILAAANPKLGRFDPLKSIHDQIDIPETLLSRFDLKFALMDIPNVEIDTKMAEHILKSMEPTYEKAIPVIDPKLLRKYVAYARKNCFPTMPEDVGEMIKKFYLDMRSKSMGRGTISITARQFEALRRLSEASAKVRLSPVVTAEDANRAIRLLQYSLQQLGLDRETGLIDIDRAEGGISSSQRNKIRIIIDIIDELTREIGKVMSLDDIISAAEQEGISASDAIDVIDSLKRDGQIIEPKFRHIQKV